MSARFPPPPMKATKVRAEAGGERKSMPSLGEQKQALLLLLRAVETERERELKARPLSPPRSRAQEEMDAARLPYVWRDYCAHLLIPLNECRSATYYMPWKCKHEKHVYEKCQYKVCLWRRRPGPR